MIWRTYGLEILEETLCCRTFAFTLDFRSSRLILSGREQNFEDILDVISFLVDLLKLSRGRWAFRRFRYT